MRHHCSRQMRQCLWYTGRMNRGGRNTSIQGFTIVETLIVLAVTSALFFAATLYINGQQNRTDFQVGIDRKSVV